jgi:hypothetical protein
VLLTEALEVKEGEAGEGGEGAGEGGAGKILFVASFGLMRTIAEGGEPNEEGAEPGAEGEANPAEGEGAPLVLVLQQPLKSSGEALMEEQGAEGEAVEGEGTLTIWTHDMAHPTQAL